MVSRGSAIFSPGAYGRLTIPAITLFYIIAEDESRMFPADIRIHLHADRDRDRDDLDSDPTCGRRVKWTWTNSDPQNLATTISAIVRTKTMNKN